MFEYMYGLWLALFLLAGLLTGCRASETAAFNVPQEPAQVVGKILELGEPPQIGVQGQGLVTVGRPRFLVEEERRLPTGEPSLIWVTVGETTEIYVEANGTIRAALPSDIQPGKQVKVWNDGSLLLSYPAQTGSRVIVIAE